MRLDIDVHMDYQVTCGDTVGLHIEAAQVEGQTVLGSFLDIENATLQRMGIAGEKTCAVLSGDVFKLHYRAQVDVFRPVVVLNGLDETPQHALPEDVAYYLQPSRYCQSDQFTDLVRDVFGHLQGGDKIDAMVQWFATEMAYVPGSSNAGTTAIDTFTARAGVCRDYTHLLCSLARAANIPARYTSVYGFEVQPPDFHAVAQVWLAGAWHLVDATGMCAAPALVVIGHGRDAGDVSFMETEHWAQPVFQSVSVSKPM